MICRLRRFGNGERRRSIYMSLMISDQSERTGWEEEVYLKKGDSVHSYKQNRIRAINLPHICAGKC